VEEDSIVISGGGGISSFKEHRDNGGLRGEKERGISVFNEKTMVLGDWTNSNPTQRKK